MASEENIIGIRPIDAKSTSLIESGKYSSKGLAIKGKSADWGLIVVYSGTTGIC
ncbi:hypothetical protein J4727_08970 [Providencia rettgeri]|uniref:Anthrax toxin edema factor central domain-containing protein n=1 Tax=Providencia rettgeri TaxID=587 RepID=A0A939NFF3_PRORE|nr:hypothetical protein [Providencia rettgeri]